MMGKKRYKNGKLTQQQILKLFKDETYSANIETGEIFGRNGKPLTPRKRTVRNKPDHQWYLYVELYDAVSGKRKSVAVHRTIWMVGANRMIPSGFEVHHEDEDIYNNKFTNLFCLHKTDHQKVHGNWNQSAEYLEDEETPF